jgi:hypothetical protein
LPREVGLRRLGGCEAICESELPDADLAPAKELSGPALLNGHSGAAVRIRLREALAILDWMRRLFNP